MIYRGTGFLLVVWFGFSPTPSPPPTASKLDQRHTGKLRKRDIFADGRGGEGGQEAESYDRKNAWSSTNHSMLSGYYDTN